MLRQEALDHSSAMGFWCRLILLACLGLSTRLAAADPSGGQAPGGAVSLAPGFVSEAELRTTLGAAALTNCFLTTVRLGADTCTFATPIGPVPMICVRMTHNSPMAFIEGSDRQGHLSLYTVAGASQMETTLNTAMTPIEKTMVQRVGDLVSASVTTQGHCLNMLLVADSVKLLLTSVSLGNICTPTYELTRMPFGYAFASEGDHINGTEFGNWRGVISYYWFTPWLTPFTAIARAMETVGMCPIDYYRIFCHGGWGTVYPATGTNPAESRTLGLIDSMWDALSPAYAPFFTYGPLHVRMGSTLVAAAHNPKSYQTGLTGMYALVGRSGYVQGLYPLRHQFCYDQSNPANDYSPTNIGTMPGVAAKPAAETNNVSAVDQNRIVSIALWPRFTCCNYCAGSIETSARHMTVGAGFLPQLVP